MVYGMMQHIFPYILDVAMEQNGFLMVNAEEGHPYADMFDVLVPNPPSGALAHEKMSAYKVLFPLGEVKIDGALKKELEEYVTAGGTLILNVRQAQGVFGEKFLGAKLTQERGTGDKIVYPGGKKEKVKNTFEFTVVKATSAKKIAGDGKGHPLALLNRYGKGNVILTTPPLLAG